MRVMEWRVSWEVLVWRFLLKEWRLGGLTAPSADLMALISTLSTRTIWPSRPMMVITTVRRLHSSNFFSLYSML